MPCPCWRSRPIGPPEPPGPLLGGRRPRRRLFFPPPPEGCRGPAFMCLFILTWLPGLIVSSSPRLRHAVGVGGYALTTGRTSHKPLNCHRERCSNQLGALELCAKGQPRSVAVGNILMLLMKASAAQGGNVHSFAHPCHYQRGRGPLIHGKAILKTPSGLVPAPELEFPAQEPVRIPDP